MKKTRLFNLVLLLVAVLFVQDSHGQDTLKGHADVVWSVSFSPDGTLLASGSGNGTIKLWDVAMGTPTAVIGEHTAEVYSVSFSPDGTLLASGSGDNTIKLWDVVRREQIASLEGHTVEVYSVAFSPDRTLLASASGDNTIKVVGRVAVHHTSNPYT